MTEPIQVQSGSDWQQFIRKHWPAFALFIAVAILAVAGAVYVFVWFTGNAQSTGLVPSTLGMWTMGNVVLFILACHLLGACPNRNPSSYRCSCGLAMVEKSVRCRKEKSSLWKRSRSDRAGGAISPLLFIAFALKVYVDGNWNVAISTYTLDYVVGSMVTILLWIVAIFAIPATIGLIWWIRHEMNKKP